LTPALSPLAGRGRAAASPKLYPATVLCDLSTAFPRPVYGERDRVRGISASFRVAVHVADRGGDLVRARDVELFKVGCEGDRRVRRGHAADRRLERIERLVGDERGNIGGKAAARRRFVDDDEPAGALDAFEDR